jgi:hypothetical protein
MLGKLLKHEWIATVRRYGLFYLVLAAVTLVAAVLHALPVDNVVFGFFEGTVLVLYVIAVIGVVFCSTAMGVIRFYKNMVSDEGYLTFTLPAKVEELVLAKFIVAYVWQIVTVALSAVSLFLVFVPGHIEMKELSAVLSQLSDHFGVLLPVFIFTLFFSLMYQILTYYLSIAIGQLFGTYKIVGAVVAYCAISFVVELALMVVMLGAMVIIGFDKVDAFMSSMNGMTKFYLFSTGWMIILGVVEYFVICHLLKKKLNLS